MNKVKTSCKKFRTRSNTLGPQSAIACLVHVTLLLCVALPSFSFAATYYVDPAAGSPSNNGSAASPWRTIQEVFSSGLFGTTILPGDTVLLRSGYHGYIEYSGGNNSSYITIAADAGHTPQLRRVDLNSCSRWIIRGLTISPELTPGAYTPEGRIFQISGTSQLITIEQCTIYSVQDSSNWSATDWISLAANGIHIDDTGVSNITIRQNHVKNVSYGILITAQNSLVERNTVENFCSDGLRGGATDQTWQYNTVKNSYQVDGRHRDGIQIYTGSRGAATGTVIRGNIFISTDDLNRPFSADGQLQGISLFQAEANHQITIENNVVITEHGNGIIVDSAVDSKIVNNIVFSRYGANGGAIDLRTSPQNTIVRNNIAYSLPANSGSVSSDHNIDLDSYNPDTFFVDWRNFNLRHKVGSPAIDAGSASDAPNTDIVGTSRPQGSGYDIGVYEYGSGSGGNLSPNADAGINQTVTDTDNNGSQQVTLNGSGSSDSDGSITSYVWTEGGSQIATGVSPAVTRTVGQHTITLTVTDDDAATDTDTVIITVQSPSNQAPNANAGPDQTVTDTDNNGSQQVTLNGSGSSDSDGSITSYVWTEGGSQIATGVSPVVTRTVGQHTITLRVTDNGGLTDTDTVTITVESFETDTTAPSIISVSASQNTLEIMFDEALDETSATNAANYTLGGGVTLDSLELDTEYNRVIIDTTTHQQGSQYTVTVSGVRDVAGNIIFTTSRNYTYASGLVGRWTFDNISGYTAYDISGYNNTATLVNGAAGTSQNEAQLAGGDDAVSVSTAGWTATRGAVALWVNASNLSGSAYLFGHAVDAWSNRIQIYLSNGNLCVGLGDSHLLSTNIELLTAQTWYHIVLNWNGTSYAVFVDGVEKATGAYAGLTQLSSTADIGNTGLAAYRTEGFNGLIDEVRIYNRTLTATEISDLALPFLPIGDKVVAEDEQLRFTIRTKPGATVTLSDHNLPATPSFTSNVFTWTPGLSDSGIYEVEFTSTNGSSVGYERIFITVAGTIQEDPIGYWNFDETSGDIAYDLSASANNGYLKNGLVWDSGKIGGAIAFSVPNDAVEIQTTNFNPNEGSITMWVYVEKQTLSRHYLFGHATENLDNRIQLYLKYGNLCLGLGNNHEIVKNMQLLQNQRWYHITLAWNRSAFRVYVDGTSRALGTFSGLTGLAGYADIGNNGIFRDKALNGKIDDVRIYNRALSAEEVAELANVDSQN